MKIELECYVTRNEDDYVKFIQYKCMNCGNFEEVTADNKGNFKLNKFHTLYVKNSKSPIVYTCHGCNNETERVKYMKEPISA